MKLTKEIKEDYVLYTNEVGDTWHLDKADPLNDNLEEIAKLIENKKAKAQTDTGGLITYARCEELGFCEEGIRLFARMAKLDVEDIEDLVLTQEEFDALVTRYQSLIFKEVMFYEVSQLAGPGATWDTKFIRKNACYSYRYARDVIKGRFPEGEEVISGDACYSYCYALDVIEGRWPEGEEAISKYANYSYRYAKHVIKGRFPEGEEVISKDYNHSYLYTKYVIKGRFPEGEEVISKHANYSYLYARDIIKGRFPEGEDAISRKNQYSYLYARDVIKGRWSEVEEAISKDAFHSYHYSKYVVKGRWLEGEEAISKDAECAARYQALLKEIENETN